MTLSGAVTGSVITILVKNNGDSRQKSSENIGSSPQVSILKEEESSDLKVKIESLNAEITLLKGDIITKNDEIEVAKSNLQNSSKEVENLKATNEGTRKELDKLKSKVSGLEGNINSKDSEIQKLKTQIGTCEQERLDGKENNEVLFRGRKWGELYGVLYNSVASIRKENGSQEGLAQGIINEITRVFADEESNYGDEKTKITNRLEVIYNTEDLSESQKLCKHMEFLLSMMEEIKNRNEVCDGFQKFLNDNITQIREDARRQLEEKYSIETGKLSESEYSAEKKENIQRLLGNSSDKVDDLVNDIKKCSVSYKKSTNICGDLRSRIVNRRDFFKMFESSVEYVAERLSVSCSKDSSSKKSEVAMGELVRESIASVERVSSDLSDTWAPKLQQSCLDYVAFYLGKLFLSEAAYADKLTKLKESKQRKDVQLSYEGSFIMHGNNKFDTTEILQMQPFVLLNQVADNVFSKIEKLACGYYIVRTGSSNGSGHFFILHKTDSGSVLIDPSKDSENSNADVNARRVLPCISENENAHDLLNTNVWLTPIGTPDEKSTCYQESIAVISDLIECSITGNDGF